MSSRARKEPERLTESHALSKGTSKGTGRGTKAATKKATKSTTKATKGTKKASNGTAKATKSTKKGTKGTKRSTSPSRDPTKGSKRSVPSMVLAAITTLGTRGGSSYQAIENQIVATHPDIVPPPPTERELGGDYHGLKREVERRNRVGLHIKVMRALRRLETEGQVERAGHSYKLTARAKRGTTRKSPATNGRTSRMPPKNDDGEKVKPKHDPDAPKRPLTSYMFYSKDVRATVKAANPTMSFGQLGTAIAAQWAKATPAQKKPYEAQAAKDRVRYETAMKTYKAAPGTAEAVKAAKADKPKRRLNGYNVYQSEEMPRIREANPTMRQPQVMAAAAAQWKKVAPAEKKRYQALAAAANPAAAAPAAKTPKAAAPTPKASKTPSPVQKAATKAPTPKASKAPSPVQKAATKAPTSKPAGKTAKK
jgi:hypothetical protein